MPVIHPSLYGAKRASRCACLELQTRGGAVIEPESRHTFGRRFNRFNRIRSQAERPPRWVQHRVMLGSCSSRSHKERSPNEPDKCWPKGQYASDGADYALFLNRHTVDAEHDAGATSIGVCLAKIGHDRVVGIQTFLMGGISGQRCNNRRTASRCREGRYPKRPNRCNRIHSSSCSSSYRPIVAELEGA